MDGQFVQLYHKQKEVALTNIKKVDAIINKLSEDSNSSDVTTRFVVTVKILSLLQKFATINYVLDTIIDSPDSNKELNLGRISENGATRSSDSSVSQEISASSRSECQSTHQTTFTTQAEKEEECILSEVVISKSDQSEAELLHPIENTEVKNVDNGQLTDKSCKQWTNFSIELDKFSTELKTVKDSTINLELMMQKSCEFGNSILSSIEKPQCMSETKPAVICNGEVENIPDKTAEISSKKQLEHKNDEIPQTKSNTEESTHKNDVTPENLNKSTNLKNINPFDEAPVNLGEGVTKKSKKVRGTAVGKLESAKIHNRVNEVMKKYQVEALPQEFDLVPLPHPIKQKDNKKKKVLLKPGVNDLESDYLKASMTVNICHIVDPSEFYVQTNQELAKALSLELNQEINKRSFCSVMNYDSKSAAKEAIGGQYGVAFIQEKQAYFRVQILDWLMDSADFVDVQLVDFGERLFCLYKYIRRMDNVFSQIPKLAIQCYFAALLPPSKPSVHPNTWPQSSIDSLFALSGINSDKKFVVVYANKDGDSFGVDLYDEESNKELSVAQILIKMGVAAEFNVVNTLEKISEDLVEFDCINEAVAGYDAQDEARICPHTNSSGTCFKGPRCKLEHNSLSKDGITTDKVFIYKEAFSKIQVPEVGKMALMRITGYVNSCHFYGQFINKKSDNSPFDTKYENLMNLMNSPKQVQTYQPFKILPGIGEVVLFKHPTGWLRGTFLGLGAAENAVEVFVVDFGSKIITNINSLRQIKEEFLYIPFQAVEVMLENYRERVNCDEQGALNFFSTYIGYREFQIEIMNSNLPIRIKLYNDDGLELGQTLKFFGFAEEGNEDLNPDPKFILQVPN